MKSVKTRCRASALENRILFDASGTESIDVTMSHMTMGHTATDPNVQAIDLHMDVIPNFVAEPDNVAVRSGSWFDAATWSQGYVPIQGEVVRITDGTTVTYDGVSDVALEAIGVEPGGTLTFATDRDTKLVVGTMLIFEHGALEIGTPGSPVSADHTAELVIADRPLDLVNDPYQFGTGILGLGTIRIHGAPKNETWIRLDAEVRAGDTVLQTVTPLTGWNPGDTIILPDTRQVPTTQINFTDNSVADQFAGNWEELVVSHVDGNQIHLASAVKYDHLGARNVDGELEFLPHVALISRNVVVRSENPDGTRGHVLFAHRADVDIRYAQFHELGRTDAFRALDNTTADDNGVVTHVGTNQIARYALHFHHVAGPENPDNVGYQYRLIGNTVDNGRKWGYVVHGTNFGLIEQNIAYRLQGAGFVTEDGTELGNDFIGNFAATIQGTSESAKIGANFGDYGNGGFGFFAHRSGNNYEGNVAVDASSAGFAITAYYHDNKLPVATVRGQFAHDGTPVRQMPPGLFRDNEVYGFTQTGIWMAYPDGTNIYEWDPVFPGVSQVHLENIRIWHTYKAGIELYHTNGVTMENIVILGDESLVPSSYHPKMRFGNGLDLSLYENENLELRNVRIEGMFVGIVSPQQDGGIEDNNPTIIRDSYLRNYINVRVVPSSNTDSGPNPTRGKAVELHNVRFDTIDYTGVIGSIDHAYDIYMDFVDYLHVAVTAPDVLRVFDFNGEKGNNFQVFYLEQQADWLVPSATERSPDGYLGPPESGITNQQLWDKYGVATAGAIAPASGMLDAPNVYGLVYQLPSFVVQGPASAYTQQEVAFSFDDVSASSTGEEFTFSIDWNGDRTFDQHVTGPAGTMVTHRFEEAGNQPIRVSIRRADGSIQNATHLIVLNDPPDTPSFSVEGPSTASTGLPVAFSLTNHLADNAAHVVRVDWNGDGTDDETFSGAVTRTIEHVFDESGSYQIRFTVENDQGTTAIINHDIVLMSRVPELVATAADEVYVGQAWTLRLDPDPTTPTDQDSYHFHVTWDENDTTAEMIDSGFPAEFSHTFTSPGTYNVHVELTKQHGPTPTTPGQVSEIMLTVKVVELPALPVSVISGPTAGEAGTALTFDLATSPDGIETYDFVIDFDGDGATDQTISSSSITAVSYTFATAGEYTISATLTDRFGRTRSEGHTVSIAPLPDAPAFTLAGPGTAETGSDIQLQVTRIDNTSPGPYTVRVDWEGDGVVDQTVADSLDAPFTLVHAYSSAGDFVATVTVVDGRDQSTTQRHTINVTEALPPPPPPPPTPVEAPDITLQGPTSLDVGQVGEFLVATVQPRPDEEFTYHVDWNNDGTRDQSLVGGDQVTLEHSFEDAGTAIVRVELVDQFGNSSEAGLLLTVNSVVDTDAANQVELPAPQVTVDGPVEAVAGDELTFLFATAETREGEVYTFHIDWNGDGTRDQSEGGVPNVALKHTFESAGSYVVHVKLVDANGRETAAHHEVSEVAIDVPTVDPPPADEPEAVEPPVVDDPVVDDPVVDPPVDDAPSVDSPTDESPPESEPTVDPPPADEPEAVEPPVVDDPVVDPPVDDAPSVDSPTDEAPPESEPTVDPPPTDEPEAVEPPVVDDPVVDPPVDDAPSVDPPTDEAPPEVEPPVDPPPTDEPTAVDPSDDSPVVDDRVVDPAVDDAPSVDSPTDEAPPKVEPSADPPPTDEPTGVDSSDDSPVVDDRVVDPPVDDAPSVDPPIDEAPPKSDPPVDPPPTDQATRSQGASAPPPPPPLESSDTQPPPQSPVRRAFAALPGASEGQLSEMLVGIRQVRQLGRSGATTAGTDAEPPQPTLSDRLRQPGTPSGEYFRQVLDAPTATDDESLSESNHTSTAKQHRPSRGDSAGVRPASSTSAGSQIMKRAAAQSSPSSWWRAVVYETVQSGELDPGTPADHYVITAVETPVDLADEDEEPVATAADPAAVAPSSAFRSLRLRMSRNESNE